MPVHASVPRELRAAAVVVGLEAAGLVVAAAVLVIKTLTESADSLGRAVLVVALALGGAAGLVVAARSLLRLRPAARSPLVVLQLLALPVGYSLGVQAGRIEYGGPILVAAVIVLVLLFTPAARRTLGR